MNRNQNTKPIKLIGFDLNKTLIKENSWLNLNTALGLSKEKDEELLDEYNKGEISYKEWQKMLLKVYKESGRHNYKNILSIIGQYSYMPYAKEVIQYLQNNGYIIAIISGSIDLLVDVVAKDLNIEYARANNLFIFNELGYLDDIVVIAERDDIAKLHLFATLCAKLEINLDECAFVGDEKNDLEIFKKVGKGVTFYKSEINLDSLVRIGNLEELMNIL